MTSNSEGAGTKPPLPAHEWIKDPTQPNRYALVLINPRWLMGWAADRDFDGDDTLARYMFEMSWYPGKTVEGKPVEKPWGCSPGGELVDSRAFTLSDEARENVIRHFDKTRHDTHS
jgi:hypothetical protein